MTRAEYDEERRYRIREQEDRDAAAALSALGLNETIKVAQELRAKYRDVPVSIKMSHETYRQLVVTRNIQTVPLRSMFGMPIILDSEIAFGEVKEEFNVSTD